MKKAWVLNYPLSASEDSDQTGRTPRLIWVFAVRTLILLVLSCRGWYDFTTFFSVSTVIFVSLFRSKHISTTGGQKTRELSWMRALIPDTSRVGFRSLYMYKEFHLFVCIRLLRKKNKNIFNYQVPERTMIIALRFKYTTKFSLPKIACPAIVYAEIVVVIDLFFVDVCPWIKVYRYNPTEICQQRLQGVRNVAQKLCSWERSFTNTTYMYTHQNRRIVTF